MGDREAFLNAIAAAPNDEAPRLVFADWLDERGEDGEKVRAEAKQRTLERQLRGILSDGKLEVRAHARAAAEIKYGEMYTAPALTFDALSQLSELFGTTQIDVDDYSQGGCETCDWGSDYGHTIQIYDPTRNADELRGLIGKVNDPMR
jgi:uncharacterized protein (TIGR02996 family)